MGEGVLLRQAAGLDGGREEVLVWQDTGGVPGLEIGKRRRRRGRVIPGMESTLSLPEVLV